MATITEPMALDGSFNTTENNSRNIADVLVGIEGALAQGMGRQANEVSYNNSTSGLSADDVQDAIDEVVVDVNGKVDKVTGKGLSTNDYTTDEKNKLAGIEAGAEVNVQSDWAQTDSNADDYIKNKQLVTEPIEELQNDVKSTQTATGNPITLTDCAPINAESLVVELEPKQEGSGDPSPTNIRPITGYTECEVDDVGFNQWDEEWEVGGYDSETGAKNNVTTKIRNKNPIDIHAYDSLYVYLPSNLTDDIQIYYYDVNMNFIGRTSWIYKGAFSKLPNAYYMNFQMADVYGTTYNHDISINYPSTDTDYHPYQSRTASVTFGQTVYGGKSNVADGGTSDEYINLIDFSNITFNGNQRGNNAYEIYFDTANKKNGADNLLTSLMPVKTTFTDVAEFSIRGFINSNEIAIKFPISVASTPEQCKQWCIDNGLQIVYEKATPDTISTPPTDLKLLKGTNHITTNGTTINLGYQPDNVIGEVKGEIQKITEMPYLRILDNDVDTEIKNYQLYYRLISSAYTLVNLAEMLQHRFLFVEVIQNPSGTSNHTLLHSALIDPRTIDGFEYQMKAGTGDTVIIESNIAENKFDLSVRYTGTHTSGDPTDYYVTIRMVD